MRVLLTTDAIGGVWTFTSELAKELLNSGHHVALLSFGRSLTDWQTQHGADLTSRFADQFSAVVSDAPLEWMQTNDSAYEQGRVALLELCDRFMPDVLHSSQFCWGAIDIPVPIVITAHSDVFSWAEACRPAGLQDTDWLRRYRRLVQSGLDGAAAVTAPTAWMAGALSNNFDLQIEIQVIANGRSDPKCDGERKLQAASVGRLWDEAKGLQTLLEVESPVPIVVAGETMASASGSSCLEFAGPLSGEQVLQLFCESSMYVATSVYEPFGLAPLEAALCGCGLLLRDLPSFREIWGSSAEYFSDKSELEALLTYFEKNPKELQASQSRALNQAKRFTARAMAAEYEHVYRRLICSRDQRDLCEEAFVVNAS